MLQVNSTNVHYTQKYITAKYRFSRSNITQTKSGVYTATPTSHDYIFRTERNVRKTGVMLVGWGGNNGTTVTAGILANKKKLTWRTKNGQKSANYWGSLTQASTIRVGMDTNNNEVYLPFSTVLPMLHPNDIVVGGWDINRNNLATAMKNAAVLPVVLQEQLYQDMKKLVPLPGIYYKDFIARNQESRANNTLSGTKAEHLAKIRQDIRYFKKKNKLERVIVFWTGNTERFSAIQPGLNMTSDEVLLSIKQNKDEVAPSLVYATAAVLENCSYINGSPQNTLVPGLVQLAKEHNVFVAGDDLKSGQTKLKSVLVDFLVSAGIKPQSIVSYNHLGNNDGYNLQAEAQFQSKKITKSNVVDDMVNANRILYSEGEHPDHEVVIKYVPFVKDSKRAMDEYISSIFLNGLSTIVIHNTCEDSLLAAPLIYDLVILTELFERIEYATDAGDNFQRFDTMLSVLGYLFKAPFVPQGTPLVNVLTKQRRCITNILLACLGLPPDTDMILHCKAPRSVI